jgi:hypothetical protein
MAIRLLNADQSLQLTRSELNTATKQLLKSEGFNDSLKLMEAMHEQALVEASQKVQSMQSERDTAVEDATTLAKQPLKVAALTEALHVITTQRDIATHKLEQLTLVDTEPHRTTEDPLGSRTEVEVASNRIQELEAVQVSMNAELQKMISDRGAEDFKHATQIEELETQLAAKIGGHHGCGCNQGLPEEPPEALLIPQDENSEAREPVVSMGARLAGNVTATAVNISIDGEAWKAVPVGEAPPSEADPLIGAIVKDLRVRMDVQMEKRGLQRNPPV